MFLCKVKKEWFYQERKKKSDVFLGKKKTFLKEDSHSWREFIMHASHIKKLQPNFQSLLLNFKICNFVTKKTFSKKSDLYLMKI